MESKLNEIYSLLSTKSSTKQFVYRNTLKVFEQFKARLKQIEADLSARISAVDTHVEIKYSEIGLFETHLKFSGDTMVMMMHTNVFDFSNEHILHKNPYIQEDPLREFCGMIQVYNFLSDSIKYNRSGDAGILVARIFVNKDNHFFIEGKRPLSFLYPDIAKGKLTEDDIGRIIEEAMLYCLKFDLTAPPIDQVAYITVDQKNFESYSSGTPTSKALGFQMNRDTDPA